MEQNNVRWRLTRDGDWWIAGVEVVPTLEGGACVLGDGSPVSCGIAAKAQDEDPAGALAKAAAVAIKMTDDPILRESLPPQAQAKLAVLRAVAVAIRDKRYRKFLAKVEKYGSKLSKKAKSIGRAILSIFK